MFDYCKNKYEACDKAISFIYEQNYLDNLDNDSYLRLIRQAKFLFESGMKWEKEQLKRLSIKGTIGSTISGSEQYVSAPVGYGEYGKDGDKVKVIVIKEE